jgi:hypothetical protein
MESMRNLMLVAGGSENVLDLLYERDEALREAPVDNKEGQIIYVDQPAAREISDEMFAPPEEEEEGQPEAAYYEEEAYYYDVYLEVQDEGAAAQNLDDDNDWDSDIDLYDDSAAEVWE